MNLSSMLNIYMAGGVITFGVFFALFMFVGAPFIVAFTRSMFNALLWPIAAFFMVMYNLGKVIDKARGIKSKPEPRRDP